MLQQGWVPADWIAATKSAPSVDLSRVTDVGNRTDDNMQEHARRGISMGTFDPTEHGHGEDYLYLCNGDTVRYYPDTQDGGWVKARNDDGATGWVPEEFIQEVIE